MLATELFRQFKDPNSWNFNASSYTFGPPEMSRDIKPNRRF